MADVFEIDFLDVESDKSGDAITLRYESNGKTFIHVVDGGFQDTGASVLAHLKKYYGDPKTLNHVVVTHPDGDHAGGLRAVLEDGPAVEAPWMLRPWQYAQELLPRFKKDMTLPGLVRRLKEIYPNIAALEEIAIRKKIEIFEPFQGASIGAFRVLPSATAVTVAHSTPLSTGS